MFGKSGCGQTTLLSYLTKNNQLKGVDSMSTQQFYAETIDIQSKSEMAKVRIHESPGMCSGFEIPQLEEHWNRLIEGVNDEGGVSIFLLLIKSNERIISQLIDELEEFSELYFKDKEEMWKRTVIVFTTIDELNGCSTFEERVAKLESQIAMRGMEKVKGIIDRTGNKCLYVSCIDQADKYRLLFDLKDRIISIYRFNGFNGYLSETETDSNTSIPYPKKSVELQDNHRECHQLPMSNHKKLFKGNNIVSLHPFTQSNRENSNVTSFEMKEFKSNHHDTDDNTSDLADRKMRANTISGIPNMDFGAEDDEFDHIQQLNREELIKLVQEMCQDKKGRKLCNKKFSKLFLTKEPPLKKGKKEKFQP
ncbi:hypothetical protein LOD99_11164 [Oopsacas minuta]|uniref:AIG1-type G domain-containing protein n=1 Tax=Oopsacas minuta TaxID=111878 RepID=A0AAV7K8R8_9METZ|nr:hypothetical protein LOD99_11164 [Oopsacas minuta]